MAAILYGSLHYDHYDQVWLKSIQLFLGYCHFHVLLFLATAPALGVGSTEALIKALQAQYHAPPLHLHFKYHNSVKNKIKRKMH